MIDGSSKGTDKRLSVLFNDYKDPDLLRKLAGSIKDHTLHHLDEYQFGITRATGAIAESGSLIIDDVEGILIEGVYGPGDQIALLV